MSVAFGSDYKACKALAALTEKYYEYCRLHPQEEVNLPKLVQKNGGLINVTADLLAESVGNSIQDINQLREKQDYSQIKQEAGLNFADDRSNNEFDLNVYNISKGDPDVALKYVNTKKYQKLYNDLVESLDAREKRYSDSFIDSEFSKNPAQTEANIKYEYERINQLNSWLSTNLGYVREIVSELNNNGFVVQFSVDNISSTKDTFIENVILPILTNYYKKITNQKYDSKDLQGLPADEKFVKLKQDIETEKNSNETFDIEVAQAMQGKEFLKGDLKYYKKKYKTAEEAKTAIELEEGEQIYMRYKNYYKMIPSSDPYRSITDDSEKIRYLNDEIAKMHNATDSAYTEDFLDQLSNYRINYTNSNINKVEDVLLLKNHNAEEAYNFLKCENLKAEYQRTFKEDFIPSSSGLTDRQQIQELESIKDTYENDFMSNREELSDLIGQYRVERGIKVKIIDLIKNYKSYDKAQLVLRFEIALAKMNNSGANFNIHQIKDKILSEYGGQESTEEGDDSNKKYGRLTLQAVLNAEQLAENMRATNELWNVGEFKTEFDDYKVNYSYAGTIVDFKVENHNDYISALNKLKIKNLQFRLLNDFGVDKVKDKDIKQCDENGNKQYDENKIATLRTKYNSLLNDLENLQNTGRTTKLLSYYNEKNVLHEKSFEELMKENKGDADKVHKQLLEYYLTNEMGEEFLNDESAKKLKTDKEYVDYLTRKYNNAVSRSSLFSTSVELSEELRKDQTGQSLGGLMQKFNTGVPDKNLADAIAFVKCENLKLEYNRKLTSMHKPIDPQINRYGEDYQALKDYLETKINELSSTATAFATEPFLKEIADWQTHGFSEGIQDAYDIIRVFGNDPARALVQMKLRNRKATYEEKFEEAYKTNGKSDEEVIDDINKLLNYLIMYQGHSALNEVINLYNETFKPKTTNVKDLVKEYKEKIEL